MWSHSLRGAFGRLISFTQLPMPTDYCLSFFYKLYGPNTGRDEAEEQPVRVRRRYWSLILLFMHNCSEVAENNKKTVLSLCVPTPGPSSPTDRAQVFWMWRSYTTAVLRSSSGPAVELMAICGTKHSAQYHTSLQSFRYGITAVSLKRVQKINSHIF